MKTITPKRYRTHTWFLRFQAISFTGIFLMICAVAYRATSEAEVVWLKDTTFYYTVLFLVFNALCMYATMAIDGLLHAVHGSTEITMAKEDTHG